MPLPNFYPPLFYWCVALLAHTNLLSFAASFKTVLVLSVLLLPIAIWMLAWALTDGDRGVATASALVCVPLLVDWRFRMILHPSGLDYVSTFQAGLYSHPLGFILLAAWFVVYTRTRSHREHRKIALASLLLALTVLANFFNAVIATVFILATLITDATRRGSPKTGARNERRSGLIAHATSPILAAGLVLFWVVPMISEYAYFVTRPLTTSVFDYVPPIMWYWYALALMGFVVWLRRPTPALTPFLLGCVLWEGIIVFSSEFAPRWFPLQPLRFLSTLNLLLAVPIGHLGVAIVDLLVVMFVKTANRIRFVKRVRPLGPRPVNVVRTVVMSCVLLIAGLVGIFLIETPYYARAFSAGPNEHIDPVLNYAKQHTDGRYLVEHSMYAYPGSGSDVRALTSYLGAQGNEAVSVAFREASPNSIFFNPLVGALSAFSDTFGISSVLVDDIDFTEQPVGRHLERAVFIGVKYIAVASPRIKEILSHEPLINVRHDFGSWSIFELQQSTPRAQVLAYRPALVMSSLSFKQRRRNQYDFARFAEEQFTDGWFEVLLARPAETEIDKLQELDRFGALILDTYDYANEDAAFEKLRDFARSRPLILLSSDKLLYLRIRRAITEFPNAVIIDRSAGDSDQWLESEGPTFRYNKSEIRKEWQAIRRILESQKIPVNFSASITSDIKDKAIRLGVTEILTDGTPILVRVSYHPNWRRPDGAGIYATTPFFMLTFVEESVSLVYGRRWFDWIALFFSLLTFVFLCFFAVRPYRKQKSPVGIF